MKSTLFFFLFSLMAQHCLAEYIPPYWIKSDTANATVPKDKCMINGIITDYEQNPIGQGIVGTTDFKFQTKVGEDGRFEFTIPAHYTAIFFFALGYQEVVLYDYKFTGGHCVNIQFLSGISGNVQVMEKPVIYAYSESPLNVSIDLSVRGNIAFTYPILNGTWEVETSSNGIIKDRKSGKEYPYLFWDGKSTNLNYLSNDNGVHGYIIQRDTCISFLENTLTDYGLNQREKTDFITYWGPRMVQNEFAFVQFFTGEDYDLNVATLNINPEPDAILRLYMFFTPLTSSNLPFNFTNPTITPFRRTGFTLVEWGGSEISLPKI